MPLRKGRVLRFDHVTLQVSDVARSIDFYIKMLGLKVAYKNKNYLRRAGYEVTSPKDQPWGERACGLRDPDRYPIWLAQPISTRRRG